MFKNRKSTGPDVGQRPTTQSASQSPDRSVLSRYSPTDERNAHPDWIKRGFPNYIATHEGHASAGVREFLHKGHKVRIVTTYEVEVDGKTVKAHLGVDENGRVHAHATPFQSYVSAVDLVQAIIDLYPASFETPPPAGHTHAPQPGHTHLHPGASE